MRAYNKLGTNYLHTDLLDGHCESTYYHLGLTYKDMAYYEQAIQVFQKVLALNDKSENA